MYLSQAQKIGSDINQPTPRPDYLPSPVDLNLCGIDGQLSFSYPKALFQPSVEHYLAVGSWGDAPFEAVIARNSLDFLVENALSGCLLYESSSSVRALLVEQLVSEISSIDVDDVRIASVICGASPFGQHLVDLHFWSHAFSFDIGLHGNNTLLETWNRRLSDIPHAEQDVPDVTVPVVFVVGTTDLTLADLKRLKVGQGLLFDTTLMDQKKVVARLGDEHIAVCSLWSESLSVDDQFHVTSAVMSDGWREYHTTNNALGNKVMAQNGNAGIGGNLGVGGLETLKVRLNFELGRTELSLAQITALAPGHVFALPPNAAGSVDIIAGGSVIGRGDIVQIGTGIGVRIVRLD